MKITFDKNNSGFRHAIRASGGFASNADKTLSYVIGPNGKVRSTKKFMFIKFYPKITAGSQVYVPIKPKKELTTGEMIGIGTTIASLVGLVISLINATK
jgi:hypothetical protein